MIRANLKALTLIVGNIPFENTTRKLSHCVFSGSDLGTSKWLLCSLLHPRTEHHNRLDAILLIDTDSAPAYQQWCTDYDWQLAHERGRVCVETLLSINNRGRGVRPCDVTKSNGLIWEKGKHIRRLKKNTWWIFIILWWLCTGTANTHFSTIDL